MQREIKFRAWDSKSQRMYYQGEPDLEDIQSFFHHYNDNDELMQFTGLKDKNGKEIYEGDLIKRTVSTLGKESTFVEKIIFSNGAFISEDKNGNVDEIYGLFLHTIEIIGNIYETPELLK